VGEPPILSYFNSVEDSLRHLWRNLGGISGVNPEAREINPILVKTIDGEIILKTI
jgi:hypothetical protein